MKNYTLPIVVGIILTFCVVGAFSSINQEVPGLVALPDYGHGIALCQGTEDTPREDNSSYTHWTTGGIYFLINAGHMEDTEVVELEELAIKHCSQYFEVPGR